MAEGRRRTRIRIPRVRVASAFGIPIELDFSWFLVFILVVAGLSLGYYPLEFPGHPLWVDVTDGVLTAAGFFGSIVIHEIAHSLVARREGMGVEKVTLFIFGGVASLTDEPRSPAAELRMAVAGPAMSVVLSLACFGVYAAALALGLPDAFWSPLRYLADVNLIVAAFNLLPGFPMDGGRIARAGLWWATGDRSLASRVAAVGGRLVGAALAAVGIAGTFGFGPGTLWLVALGVFIERLAAVSGRGMEARVRLSTRSAREVADGPGEAFSANAPARSVPAGGERVWAVALDGVLNGVIFSADVPGSVPPHVTVGQLARQVVVEWLVDERDSAETALRRVSAGAPLVGVVSSGHLVGTISPAAIQSALAQGASRR